MKAFLYLMRRELWEHRALWIVPVCLGALMVATAIAVVTLTGYVSGGGASVRIVKLSKHDQTITDARRQIEQAASELHDRLRASGAMTGDERLDQAIARLQERLDAIDGADERDEARLHAAVAEAATAIEESARELAAGAAGDGAAAAEIGARIAREAARIAHETALVARIGVAAGKHGKGTAIDISAGSGVVVDGERVTLQALLQRFDALPEWRRAREARRLVFGIAAAFYLVVFVVVCFYALDALYGERRDRSALFWKSLPVSDLSTVLSKVATAVITAGLIALVCVILTQALIMTILSIAAAWHGMSAWQLVWKPAGVFFAWPTLLLVYAALGLWMLPVYSWAFLVSAWARRAPLVVAVVTPLIAVLLERWITGTGFLASAIEARFGRFVSVSQVEVEVAANVDGKTIALRPDLDQFRIDAVTDLFARPELWIGLIVSALLIGGAVWLRRYRDET